ncbi:hypothetical protein [Primorskyibacter sp. S87]|uniref:hypothetical protein n=1 Tax=Primorskyibacter sp. S87 TaxID=3415126 RepID=UPI003C7D50EC
MVSVTHHRSGRIDICRDGHHVACVETPAEVGAILAEMGVQPEYLVDVQIANGTDDRVAARSYMGESVA